MSNVRHIRPVTNAGEEIALEFEDTQALRALAEGGHLPGLLILSSDAALIEVARKAAPHGTHVTQAAELDDIVDRLPSIDPGVLLVDSAATQDVSAMLAQLTQHFPEMVAVVAGKREDSSALLRLTAEGRVYRFLLTPVSLGQARLALRAAAAQHLEIKASSARRIASSADDGVGKKNYNATYGALAAGLVLIVAAIWFVVSKLTDGPELPVAKQPVPTEPTPALEKKPDPVDAELALAREAFAAGKYLEPVGENALDFYQAARSLDPNNEAARLGIRSVADKVLEQAEADVTAERLESAVSNIEKARDIDPSHPRLAFLDTQIARERERLQLSQARGLGTKVRALVSQAEAQMARNRLIVPAGGNARDTLIAARKADPTDPLVVQSIRTLSATLTEEARKALAAGRTRDAQMYIDSARQLGSASATLVVIERQIADAASRRVADATPRTNSTRSPAPVAVATNVDTLIGEARQRLANGALIEPEGTSAKDSIVALRAAAPNRPEVEELARTVVTQLLESSKQAIEQKSFDRAAQLIAGAKSIAGQASLEAVALAENDLASAVGRRTNTVISAVSLPRNREVMAAYPRQALRNGTEGWVDLEFTISPEGVPFDIEVKASRPRRTFDRAATEALLGWRFQPILRDGVAIEQRANLRFTFRPE